MRKVVEPINFCMTKYSLFRFVVLKSRLLPIAIFVSMVLLLTACENAVVSTGIRVNASNNMVTTEAGAITSFTLVLHTQPSDDVIISLRTDNQNEGLVSIDNLNFLPTTDIQFSTSDWHIPKMVYIQGVNDYVDDGDTRYTIVTEPASSNDASYQSMDALDVQITNFSISVDPRQGLTSSLIINPLTPLFTSEDGSKVAQIQVSLNRQPSSDVAVSIGSLDSTEGITQPNQPELLVFSAANWNQAQTVSIYGVDDLDIDGDIDYQLIINTTSADVGFNALSVSPILLVNQDNELISPLVSTVMVSPTTGLVTSETQGTSNSASFSLQLNTSPAVGETITMNALVSDTSEAIVQPSSVVINSTNWQTAVQFTLSGVDDSVVDGNQAYRVSFSSLSSNGSASPYHAITVPDVQAINLDNEVAAVSLSLPQGGVLTSENQTNSSFSVVLDAAPLADVLITATSTNANEGLVSSANLVFSSSGVNIWNQPQTITVTGVNDDLVDGPQSYAISLSTVSADPSFDSLIIPDVAAVNADNDVAALAVILPADGWITTSENGTGESFSVVLNAAPVADVVITATSLNLAEGSVSPASLTFSSSVINAWDVPQSFTVTGVDDNILDGVQAYSLSLSVTSADVNYNSLVVGDISAFNYDNDQASVTVSLPNGGIVTDENFSSAYFSVVLDSEPMQSVTIWASSLDTSEGVVVPASISFDPDSENNWDQPQYFMVVGQSDDRVDGDQQYSISLTSSSNDNIYDGLAIPNISAINIDVDESSSDDE